MKRLLTISKGALPGATQTIKWGQPIVEQAGPIAFIKVASAHVTFGFWRGADLADADGRLEGGHRMKHIKLRAAADVDEAQLTAWLEEAGRFNAEKGDPSRRRG